MAVPQLNDLIPDDPLGTRYWLADLFADINIMRQKMNVLMKAGVSMEAYIEGPLTKTKYQDFLVNKLKYVSQEGGGSIKLPQGFDDFTGQPGFGSDPFYGTVLSQEMQLYSNVHLIGDMAYRRNALVADPALPRSATMISLAKPSADWRSTYFAGGETKSIEANFGMIGCCVNGNERQRPAINAGDPLGSHGWMINLDASSANGPQSETQGMNDAHGKMFGNVFMNAPESGVFIGGRGEYQYQFNHIASCRIFGINWSTFDNHTGFNVVSNCGHSGVLVRSGNNRFGIWKIWFIGYLPIDNRWGTRDQIYEAMKVANITGETMDQSYCVDINSGSENVDGNFHFQDTYGHGLRDAGKLNRCFIYGDMVGGMRGGDFSQVAWTGDSAVRANYVLTGKNARADIVSRNRDPSKFVGGGGTCDSYPVQLRKSNDDSFDINVNFDRSTHGFTEAVNLFNASSRPARSQGNLTVNGRKIYDRTYMKPADRVTAGTSNAINLERGLTEYNIGASATGNVGGAIANAQADNFRHTIRVRRTPGTTYKAVITGTFNGGNTLTIDADYANIDLEFVFNPGEVVGSLTGRWMIVGGTGQGVIS